MATTLTRPGTPSIALNGTVYPSQIRSDTSLTVTSEAVVSIKGNVTVTMSDPANATIRYTFNGKNPTLGSPIYDGSNPPVLRSNGNGHGSDNTVIKAKAYVNGETSETARVELNIT